MDQKQKVTAALEHRSGPVPLDIGSNPVTGIHVEPLARLREYFGLEKRPVKLIDPFQMLGEVDAELQDVLGLDTEGIYGYNALFGFPLNNWKEWVTPWGQEILVPGLFNTSKDEEGNVYLYPQGDMSVPPSGKMPASGFYFDGIVRQEPIIEENLNPEDNLEEFTLLDAAEIEHIKQKAAELRTSKRFIYGSLTGDTGLGDIARVPGMMLKHPKGIRDEAEWYMSTLIRQDYLHEVFEKETDIALKNLQTIKNIAGDVINAVFICGTDFGTQTNQFLSLDQFRRLYLPYYQKVNNWIHANTNWKTFKHSCGAIEPLLPGIIEAGFDIINPVQISAEGMDPALLKERYGDQITFSGGGSNTQTTLPFGTPEEVRAETLKLLEVFSKDGGYLFNPGHNIQSMVPTENLVSMIKAVKEFNGEHL